MIERKEKQIVGHARRSKVSDKKVMYHHNFMSVKVINRESHVQNVL